MAGVSDSLAGRVAVFELPCLCLGELPSGATDELLWRSGFPQLWQDRSLSKDLWLGSYLATYLERDVRQLIKVQSLRDFDRFLRALAMRCGQLLSFSDLSRDVGVSPNTIKSWVSLLETSHQIFLLEPWFRQQTKRLIKSPKVYFCDTGLLLFLLGVRRLEDLRQTPAWGAIWENMVINEIRKQERLEAHRRSLWYWRTTQGDELDLLIEEGPQRFRGIEIKAAEHPDKSALKGFRSFMEEYGPDSLVSRQVVCRCEKAFPLGDTGFARAESLEGFLAAARAAAAC